MQDDHGNETVGNSAITPSGPPGAATIGRPDPAMLQKKNEHMARGIAYRERGEYVRAIDEFVAACQLATELGNDWEECDDNLERMLFVLHDFFNPDVDPDHFRFWEGEPLPEATLKELAARTCILPGYLVTGGNYVYASYPLTAEGRVAAIEHADRLANEDWQARYEYPGTALADVPDFNMIVYKHETRPEEIYRVPSS
jgi:hypothetical protein